MSETLKYTGKLKDARVLVIGGSSGIGFGVAEALIELKAHVFISSSSADRVKKAVERIQKSYPSGKDRIHGVVCNLGSQETMASEIARLFSEVTQSGKLDHVVYTAGDALAIRPIESFTLPDMIQAGMVRYFGPLMVAQHLREHLKGGTASSLTLTTGGNMEPPAKDWTVANAYLVALRGVTKGLSLDLAPIRVNLISPGPVETEMWEPWKEAGHFDTFKTALEARMTTKTIGKVEDVVECYLYVMKDRNVAGSVITTDGGSFVR